VPNVVALPDSLPLVLLLPDAFPLSSTAAESPRSEVDEQAVNIMVREVIKISLVIILGYSFFLPVSVSIVLMVY
jgi:hypothetical protein